MQLAVAQQAGTLAAAIVGVNAIIVGLTQAIADKAIISGTTQIADPTNNVSSFNLPPLTADESAQMFKAALAVFNARLSVLQSQLDAM